MNEYEKAKAWREKHGYSQQALADALGYSREVICWNEAGRCPPGRRGMKRAHIAENVWRRYKLACAGLDAQIKSTRKFNW